MTRTFLLIVCSFLFNSCSNRFCSFAPREGVMGVSAFRVAIRCKQWHNTFPRRRIQSSKQLYAFPESVKKDPSLRPFSSSFQRRSHLERCRLRFAAHLHDIPSLRFSNETKSAAPYSRSLVEETFLKLARKGRSWRRLRHLVDLACIDTGALAGTPRGNTVRSAADIGCDHGLLTVGLAISGRFQRVIGVDLSERALEDGALSLQKNLLSLLKEFDNKRYDQLPVQFRLGDGLSVLQFGEADVICIAGMGVHTMIEILCRKDCSGDSNKDPEQQMDSLGCRMLLLQPTNSKPRHLVLLYDRLQSLGWCVSEERIEKVSSRWYISSCFVRVPVSSDTLSRSHSFVLPGEKLLQLGESDLMSHIYREYVEHHTRWLHKDMKSSGKLDEGDKRWLQANNVDQLWQE